MILLGDSREWLPRLRPGSIDLIFGSPPYNVGKEYDVHDDAMPRDEWVRMMEETIRHGWALLKQGGRMVVNIQHTVGRSPAIPLGSEIERIIGEQPEAYYRGAVVWHTLLSGAGYSSWGSFESPADPVFRGEYEMIYCFSRGKARTDRSGPGDFRKGEFLRATRDVWDGIPTRLDPEHPAPFPPELARRVIQFYTWPGDTVLDPWLGSGTTAVVAKALGREWVGIDISRTYCELAARRITTWEGVDVPPIYELDREGIAEVTAWRREQLPEA